MKIPGSLWKEQCDTIRKVWEEAALQVSMESGVYVTIGTEGPEEPFYAAGVFRRIFFQIEDKKFESLQALRRALNLKAFL